MKGDSDTSDSLYFLASIVEVIWSCGFSAIFVCDCNWSRKLVRDGFIEILIVGPVLPVAEEMLAAEANEEGNLSARAYFASFDIAKLV